MTRLSLPIEVVNATLEYLATCPYREVMNLIPAIQAAVPVPESTLEPETEEIEHAAQD